MMAVRVHAGLVRNLSTRVKPASGGKAVSSSAEAIKDITSGSTLLVGGFGLSGVPDNLLKAINVAGLRDLTVVSSNVGTADHGLGPLFRDEQISKMMGSYVGENEVHTDGQPLSTLHCPPAVAAARGRRQSRRFRAALIADFRAAVPEWPD